jgi:hypothetical protein
MIRDRVNFTANSAGKLTQKRIMNPGDGRNGKYSDVYWPFTPKRPARCAVRNRPLRLAHSGQTKPGKVTSISEGEYL